MNSLDAAHVPTPDPAYLWRFAQGERKLIAAKPHLMLHCQRVLAGAVLFALDWNFGNGLNTVSDWLNLNAPCVALRDKQGAPWLTLTLRETRPGECKLQITAHPDAKQIPREAAL